MTQATPPLLARELIEEIIRTCFTITDTLDDLVDSVPEDAFPGEDSAMVLVEMVAGSCTPAIEAAGEETCRGAIALLGAVRDRFIDDLRTAAALARGEGASEG